MAGFDVSVLNVISLAVGEDLGAWNVLHRLVKRRCVFLESPEQLPGGIGIQRAECDVDLLSVEIAQLKDYTNQRL